jgi:D-threo-aldose 1-dehydrogenase
MAVGTVPIGGLFDSISYDDARAVVEAAWDTGIRFFDVAPLYGYGFAERVLGDMLRDKPRESFSVSTKVGRLLSDVGPTEREDTTVLYKGEQRFRGTTAVKPYFDFTYDGVMRSIEASRERLGIERFDVIHIHDPEWFMDEAIDGAYRALDELRNAKAVDAIGVGSNSWETHAELARRAEFDCFLVAGRYSLLDQSALSELLPLCEERGIAFIAAGVFNSGILAHPDPQSISAVGTDPGSMSDWKDNVTFDYEPANPTVIARAARIKAVCGRHGIPLIAAALQFPLHHPSIPCVLVGPRTTEQVETNNQMLRLSIPHDMWRELKSESLIPDDAPTPQ